ncbi:RNA 2'-phosphotransferase [Sandaracinus amylolyticus]|uniref:RNA 2'-phosphotransferase n=1 Tax=Sandaracinus amylolyticus TaxID=927083 RepID=UPI001F3399B9|nr:RNA 2'-phosphotransferase [Sandaracinus amylolyticus]UJR80473.1 RNA 2'-phosphotransferase [Sandaracinus amylolyticus]
MPSVQLSKRLAWALRHRPDALGITLDPAGWTDVDGLLDALVITREQLDAVLAMPGKRRFELEGSRIRALHGHSVAVDVDHPASAPPEILFHGTIRARLASIRAKGLVAGARRHVHLAETREEAIEVGARRGPPIVIEVRAAVLHARGVRFSRAPGSRVWLVDHVPAACLVIPE